MSSIGLEIESRRHGGPSRAASRKTEAAIGVEACRDRPCGTNALCWHCSDDRTIQAPLRIRQRVTSAASAADLSSNRNLANLACRKRVVHTADTVGLTARGTRVARCATAARCFIGKRVDYAQLHSSNGNTDTFGYVECVAERGRGDGHAFRHGVRWQHAAPEDASERHGVGVGQLCRPAAQQSQMMTWRVAGRATRHDGARERVVTETEAVATVGLHRLTRLQRSTSAQPGSTTLPMAHRRWQ